MTLYVIIVRKFPRWLFTVFSRLFFTLTILFKLYFLYLFPHFLPHHIFPIPHNDSYRLTCYPQYSFHYYPSVTYSSHYLAVTYYRSDSRYLLTKVHWKWPISDIRQVQPITNCRCKRCKSSLLTAAEGKTFRTRYRRI